MGGFLAARGHWDQAAALHQTALAAARQAGDRLGEADALTELGALQARDRGLPGRRRQPGPGAGALPRYRRPARPGLRPQPAGHRASADRRLPGRRRQPPAGAGAGPRLWRPARPRPDALNNLGLLQQLTGDYPAAAASLASRPWRCTVTSATGTARPTPSTILGVVQQETGDYPAAAASQQQALALFRDLGDRPGQAYALNDLGLVQQQTGDYPAAAASHQQALALFRDLGNRLGQAEALNRLGELSLRTSATGQARDQHTQALAIARDLGAPLEEARALEGIGHSHLQDGNPSEAAAHLRQALAIYQRIGAPAAQRVQETLHRHRLTSTTPDPQPAAPGSEDHRPRIPAPPLSKPIRKADRLGTRPKPGVRQDSLPRWNRLPERGELAR